MGPVLIQGVLYGACNLNNIAFGVPVVGITAISWSRKQNTTNEYGLGQEPIGAGYGQISYEGKITVYKEWWKAVKDARPDKDPFSILPFNWTISYGNATAPGLAPVAPFTETLRNFRFMEDNFNANSGDTKLLLDIPFVWAGLIVT